MCAPSACEQRVDMLAHAFVVLRAEEPARDSGLIRDDDTGTPASLRRWIAAAAPGISRTCSGDLM